MFKVTISVFIKSDSQIQTGLPFLSVLVVLMFSSKLGCFTLIIGCLVFGSRKYLFLAINIAILDMNHIILVIVHIGKIWYEYNWKQNFSTITGKPTKFPRTIRFVVLMVTKTTKNYFFRNSVVIPYEYNT